MPTLRFIEQPRALAALLAIPTALIGAVSLGLIPWLLETRARLDNEDWENQLLFAASVMIGNSAPLPFLIMRALGWKKRLTMICWPVLLASYALMIAFLLQSHLKELTAFIGMIISPMAVLAVLGWRSDRS